MHAEPPTSACFEWNDHSGGPVIVDVELNRFTVGCFFLSFRRLGGPHVTRWGGIL